jgi:hypothetical protein
MRTRFVRGLICLAVLAVISVLAGCETTPAQARSRARAWRINKDYMAHEWDWIMGVDDPSILYQETMPPYW